MLRTFLKRLFSSSSPSLLEPGTVAPTFSCLSHHGETVQSTDLAGQRFVLWFYPKAATPG